MSDHGWLRTGDIGRFDQGGRPDIRGCKVPSAIEIVADPPKTGVGTIDQKALKA